MYHAYLDYLRTEKDLFSFCAFHGRFTVSRRGGTRGFKEPVIRKSI